MSFEKSEIIQRHCAHVSGILGLKMGYDTCVLVEWTRIIALCLSLLSISLLYPLHYTLNIAPDYEFYQTLDLV